jgi:outer membrane receptor for ferrienterochelin and colicin
MLRLRRALLSLVLAAVLTPAASVVASVPAAAQAQAGSITGTVSSDQGPLAGATISVSGAASHTVTSRKDGTFAVTGLPDGAYLVSVTHSGFAAVRNTAVTIISGVAQTLAVNLVADSLTSLRTIGSVTADGGRTSAALNTSAAAESTITTQQFTDRGQTQVVDMLEEQPGVEITRVDSGALGSNADIALRGANPYETQVLIDGHPVNGGSQGKYLIQFLNPLILSDVEIDKGPGAFGNSVENAVGGSVNFRTPQITTTPTGTFLAGYDSFNGSTYGARFSDTIGGKFGFLVAYAETGTPGYFTNQNVLSVTSAGPNDVPKPGGPPVDATVNTSILSSQTYNNRSELLKLDYNFSPTTTLTAGFYGSQSYVDYTGTLGTVEPYTIVGSCTTCGSSPTFTNPIFANFIGQTVLAANGEDDLFAGNYETDSEPIFTFDLRSAIGRGTFLARYYAGSISRLLDDPGEATQIRNCLNPACNPASFTDDVDFQEDETDQLHGGDFEYDLPIGLSSLTLSYDSHDDRSTFCENSSTTPFPLNCTSNGLLIASNTISLRGYISLSSKLTLGLANYFSNTTFVGSRYDPRASLVYKPGKYEVLRAAVGTAFVAPFSGFLGPVAGANGSLGGAAVLNDTLDVVDNLKPETSQSFDIGGDFATGPAAKFTLDLYNTIVHNRFATEDVDLTDGLTGTFDGTPFTKIDEVYNQSDSHEQGIEIGFIKAPHVGFGSTITFELSHDYDFDTVANPVLASLPVVASQTGTFNGIQDIKDNTQIPGFAYSKGHAEINYAFEGGARVAFGMTYYGDYNSFGQTAFELFDANFGIPLQHGFHLQVAGNNIFDHDDGRDLGEFEQGAYTPVAAPGDTTSPVSLFFAPPRQVTIQLSHPL